VEIFSIPFNALGSACELRLAAMSATRAKDLSELAITEIARIEKKYSRYRSDSILSKINQQAGIQAVAIDPETAELLDYADLLYQTSEGLFDITSGVLRQAWDFKTPHLPDPQQLDLALSRVGWHNVERGESSVFLRQPGMEIDFGGFGKEYAVDRVSTLLQQQGVQSGLVDLGGDLRILGPQPNGQAWNIGIQNPRQSGKTIAHLPVMSGALTTSGDYERYIEVDGKRYCHILNPKTGYPVQYWQSVSVLAPVAIAAGSYATIAMLMQEQAEAWLQECGLAYLLVDARGQVRSRNAQ
jgi:thiamine biosynthesis lipoprotein